MKNNNIRQANEHVLLFFHSAAKFNRTKIWRPNQSNGANTTKIIIAIIERIVMI